MPYYDHDKDYPFAAFITNLGKYNEGELVGEWVKFPTTAEELKEVFKRIGIGQKDDFGQPYEEWFITDYDCYVDGLYSKLGEYENLDELNYLASKLDEMRESEYAQFQAGMEMGDHCGSLQEIINLTENLDCYEVYPDIHDYDDLGRYYIEELDVIVCFDIKELGKQLKSLGMLVIQDQVWNRVSQNRDQGKSTWYFVDEFHLLLRGEVGSWSVEIWKRFRKWGGIPTGITQNIKDLLSSPEIENIFENSDFVYLLNQASGDRKILCERLNISNQQAAHISNAGPGEGLIFFGNVILPFVDDFPKDNELYSIMTTKLGETGKGENEHE